MFICHRVDPHLNTHPHLAPPDPWTNAIRERWKMGAEGAAANFRLQERKTKVPKVRQKVFEEPTFVPHNVHLTAGLHITAHFRKWG